MSIIDTDSKIDDLLMFMNEKIEDEGCSIGSFFFNFNEGGKYFNNLGWTNDELIRILNVCKSRKLLEKKTMGRDNSDLVLTRQGQGRAISIVNGRKKISTDNQQMSIGNITVNGPAQVGNGNVQNIESLFYNLVEQIDKSNATEEEKKEAKGLLRSFLEHPLTSAVVGGATGGLIGFLK